MIANLTISVLWLPVIVMIAAYAGFFFRSAQLNKSRKRINYLENEMLINHAEILRLQHEIVQLEKNSGSPKSRVVPMKELPTDESSESNQKKKSNK
jgi:hypothetical protein